MFLIGREEFFPSVDLIDIRLKVRKVLLRMAVMRQLPIQDCGMAAVEEDVSQVEIAVDERSIAIQDRSIALQPDEPGLE